MPFNNFQAVEAYCNNGKRVRGIYRREVGTFEAKKGKTTILVPEFEYSFDFKVGKKRFRSMFGKESDLGEVGANGKWKSHALEKAVEALLKFKKNAEVGEGPASKAEEIEMARQAIEEKKRLEKREKTVEELIELFLEDIAISAPGIKSNKPRTIKEYRLNLYRDVIPEIGERKAKAVEREDIADIIYKIVKRGRLVQANRTLAACSRLFNWALSKGRVRYNPCAQMKKYDEKPRDRVLTEPEKKEITEEKPLHQEIKNLWEKLSEKTQDREARILLLCILLGARPGEICLMRWEDIGSDNWWSLVDTKVDQIVLDCYLTRTSLEILGEKKDKGFVFPMETNNTKPIPVNYLSKYVRDNKWFNLNIWQPRDLRRTFTTLSKGFGFTDNVVNKAQARKDSSIIRVHYDKRQYYLELKQLFETVETEILRIVANNEEQ